MKKIVLQIQAILGHIPKFYIFPVIIFISVLVLSSLHISGTSMGVYDYMFGDANSNLIVGQPRTVRSDEWTVTTPFTIVQSVDRYPAFNKDIGKGQDMSLVVDVPYSDWSAFFKPQNLMFFVAPLEFAFAFKWWFLAATLAISVYLFILLLYPKRYLMATLLAVFFVFNPFIQWWYQTITLLPIAYSLLIVTLVITILREKRLKPALLYSILLAYILSCFVLLMYPAFQISVSIVAAVIIFGILGAKKELHLFTRKRNLVLAAIVSAASIAIVCFFIFQHLDTIKSTLSTIYPGARNIDSGGFNPIKLLTWPFSYLLLSSATAGSFNNNQSEISNFLLFGFICLPFLFLLWWRSGNALFTRFERVLLVSLSATSFIIFWRIFVPFGDPLFKLFGLSKVPHVRLFIALGIINLVFLAIAIGRKYSVLKSIKQLVNRYHLIVLCSTAAFYTLLITFLIHHFVLFTVGLFEAILVITTLSTITTLILSEYIQPRYAGLTLLCIFAICSAGLANPLYRGLSLPSNPLVTYVSQQEKADEDYWISNDQPYLSSAILSSGAELYGGVNTYPQTELWEHYFPNDEAVFNRYAHIRFKIDQSANNAEMSLIQGDSFHIILPSCDPLLKNLHIRHIVSDVDLGENLACYPHRYAQIFDKKPLYIYSY